MKHCNHILYFLFFSIQSQSQNPILIAPSDIVISCGFQFTDKDLNDTLGVLFGSVVFDSSSRNKLHTYDILCHKFCEPNTKTGYPGPIPPNPPSPPAGSRACNYYLSLFDTLHKDRMYDLTWGYDGYIKNPIKLEVSITVVDNRTCHQGKILRTFSTPGPNNTEIKASQTIWVVDCSPFDIFNPQKLGHSMVISGCGIPPPDSTQKPKIPDDSCASISINYIDFISQNDPEYFYTITRRWEIIDYCQFEPNKFPETGRWFYNDTIYVIDNKAPINTIQVDDCKKADSTGYARVGASIDFMDNCTAHDWIYCTYYIDLYNDAVGVYGGYDLEVGPLSYKEFLTGQKPLINDNPFATFKNNPVDASGNYPVGRHKILFKTWDAIGNIAKDSAYFEILPLGSTKFECPTHDFNIPVELPKTYVFTLKDIIIFYEDNCTPYANLKVFLDGDSSKTSDLINCIDYLENGSKDTLKRTYEVWVQDASGNATICPIHVNYIFKGNCDSLHTTYFTGKFFDRNNNDIEDLNLEISSPLLLGPLYFSTVCTNSFTLSSLEADTAYYIGIKKHDFLNNGIDVLDPILLQEHLFGVNPIVNKLSLFAGDVNFSGTITAADGSTLVNRILRLLPNFPTESDGFWEFFNVVGKDTLFTYPNLYVTDPNTKFIGIKIGDVNGDALAKCKEQKIKPNICLNLTHTPLNLEKGKTYFIPFFSSNFKDIIGMQASFQFDQNILRLDTIIRNKLSPQFNLMPSFINNGVFNILEYSNSINEENYLITDTLFYLKITALQNYTGNDFLKVTDDPTYAIAYDINEHPLNICINSIPTKTSDLQNDRLVIYPNPTNRIFNIQIPENTQSFVLKIFNAFGQTVYSNDYPRYSGSVISIDGKYVSHAGAYYVTLQTKERIFNSVLIKL